MHAEITTGQYATKQVVIPRIPLSPLEKERYQFKFIRKQFPVHIYFVMTIKKAQSQMLDYNCHNMFSCMANYMYHFQGKFQISPMKVLVMTEQPDRKTGTYTRHVIYKKVLVEIQLITLKSVMQLGKS